MSIYESILITGGGGMLARASADLLREKNLSPISLTRAELDIADEGQIAGAFAKYRPTLLLNCAAHTKVDLCEQEREKADAINGIAVGTLARHCRTSGACLVHLSTDFVFDGKLKRPYRPDDPVNPINAYGRSKLLGEKQLQASAPPRWLIVRTSWVYGRGGVNFPRTMVQAAKAGKPLRVVNDQLGCPTYAVDLAQAIFNLLDANARGIWHVTNSGQTTWFDFAKATLQEFGITAPVEPLTSAQWMEMRPNSAVRPTYSVLDNEPYAWKTEQPMRSWKSALADFHAAVERDGF